MNIEEWRSVPGFSNYEVSSHGHMRRVGKSETLRTSPGKKGYLKVFLRQEGREKCWRIHSLVALVFIGPKPTPRHHAAHWDGDVLNCRVTNLRWATPIENESDKIRHGRTGKNQFLTDGDIVKIKEMLSAGISASGIANVFSVSDRHIRRIRSGEQRISSPV